MKLDVLIPSRGREQSMQAVLLSLNAMESGANEVRYTVLCDDDDSVTKATALTLRDMNVRVVSAQRTLVNARENAIISASDADAFMPWADDLFCLAAHWDEIARRVLEKVPGFSWQEVQDPQNHTAIVLSRAWVKAAGRFFPEHFPFWFADTWLKEVFGFVYGTNMPIVDYLQFSHKRTPTQQMRDLAFWFRVFALTRLERIEEARRVAKACGVDWQDRPNLIDLFEKGDAMQLERVPQYEAAFGANRTEPSDAYLAAKAKADGLFVKDVERMRKYWESVDVESLALRPKPPFAEAA